MNRRAAAVLVAGVLVAILVASLVGTRRLPRRGTTAITNTATTAAPRTALPGAPATSAARTAAPTAASTFAASQGGATPSLPALAGSPVPTVPPPLAKTDFPAQPIGYPAGWPDELRLPDQFALVEAASGTLPDGQSHGWAAKFRYRGTREQAIQALVAYFQGRGWQVLSHDLDAGTTVLAIEHGNRQSTGSLILDTDPGDPGSVRVLLTVRL